MSAAPIRPKMFVGLVSFRKGRDLQQFLPTRAEGAVGWQAGKAENEDQFIKVLRANLEQIGLELDEVEKIREVESVEEIRRIDDHLGSNVETWEAGKSTVWGTIHIYLADGEA